MSKIVEIYKQLLKELENEKKLARNVNQKNVKIGGGQAINHDYNNR